MNPKDIHKPSQIEIDNVYLLSQMKAKERIGVDTSGRLFKIDISKLGFIERIKVIFQRKPSLEVQKAVESSVKSFFRDVKVDQEFNPSKIYQDLILKLYSGGYTETSTKENLVSDWYDQRYEQLRHEGVDEKTAEATITIEMCHDSNVPYPTREKIAPVATSGGTSGSYFIKNRSGEMIGVFKPRDEEVYMPNNPKGRKAQLLNGKPGRVGPRSGHLQGVSWKKEVAAWVIDKGQHVKVPETRIIHVPFKQSEKIDKVILKEGSFQFFASGVPVEDLTKNQINEIPTKQVQQLGAFDIICGNADRNDGNILWDKGKRQLTPIDHGLILMDSLDWTENGVSISETSSYLLTWDQCDQSIDSDVKEWIEKFDIDEKSQELADAGISQSSINEFRIRGLFLKEAVSKGHNMFEIGKMVTSQDPDSNEPCLLDQLCNNVRRESMKEGKNEIDFDRIDKEFKDKIPVSQIK